jgi:hypothetical protein
LQLFGSVTFWLFWPNGYEALRALDDNHDGSLAGRELAGMAIWRDGNSDGVSDSGEVKPLSQWGIVKLSCVYEWDESEVAVAFSRQGATFENGTTRRTYDILLHQQRN